MDTVQILRKQSIQFWLKMFKALQENGHLSGPFLDKSLIQFCFLDLVQEWMKWCECKIRPGPGQDVHGGHTVLMDTVPQVYGAEDELKTADLEEVAVFKDECTPKNQFTCDFSLYTTNAGE
ncbi:hypothetical protein N1851_018385 [Merluccius polli]|uniref:Uncharacterized protein n=1 Tax=Merluccius polli TaxID=89951 RepID=A0AA47MN64_MERPO|nr:hypothetical protein N1851_018385 [Merluccius polli]